MKKFQLQKQFLNLDYRIRILIIYLAVIGLSAVSIADQKSMNTIPSSVFNGIAQVDTISEKDIVPNAVIKSLSKEWYQLPITQGGDDMFNPVFLPFEYICNAGVKDVKQPMTFPCLLAFKFDFVPDNFSARHPAFIYRKMPIWNVTPEQPQQIARYISYWEATHAIGGSVIQNKDGYCGKLLVFDKTGKEILSKTYDQPKPYFTLMGEMVKTWMDYRQQEVSAVLFKELIRPMTNSMECVRLYGQSFYKAWRTNDEWEIYENILNIDPGFGEVRFWYANQKSWATDEFDTLQVEKGKALQNHLVMPALNEFNFNKCPDKDVVSNYYQMISYAEKICGENCTVYAAKLYSKGNKLTLQELNDLSKIVQKYPCAYDFMTDLGWEYHKRGCFEKSIPLFLSAIYSGYLKGSGRFDWEWHILAGDFLNLGYVDESIYCSLQAIRDCSDKRKPHICTRLGQAYRERNHYKKAASLFQAREKLLNDKWGRFFAYMSVCQKGALSLVQDLQIDTTPIAKFSPMYARTLLAEGKPSEAIAALPRSIVSSEIEFLMPKQGEGLFENRLVATDIYLLSKDYENAKKQAMYAWYICPRSRQVGYLLEHAFFDEQLLLARYAKVGCFICGDDPYWSALHSTTKSALQEDTAEIVKKTYEMIQEDLRNKTESVFLYWQKFSPFEIEYICLYLLEQDNPSVRDDVLSLYLNYRKSIKSISEWQQGHTRVFFLQLLELVPDSERQKWVEKLYYAE